jgi:hypothetical protein
LPWGRHRSAVRAAAGGGPVQPRRVSSRRRMRFSPCACSSAVRSAWTSWRCCFLSWVIWLVRAKITVLLASTVVCWAWAGRVRARRFSMQPRGQFSGEGHGDSRGSSGDHAGVVEQIAGGDQRVQLGQRGDGRDRDEVPAAEAADLALDPAFLVRSVLAGAAEERVEAVVAAQRDEPLRLFPVPSPEHAHDGGLRLS